jgi:heme exporter protein D
MSFDSVGELLTMGGHGLYVWMSYGASVIVVVANVIAVRRARARTLREARALERRLAATGAGAEIR